MLTYCYFIHDLCSTHFTCSLSNFFFRCQKISVQENNMNAICVFQTKELIAEIELLEEEVANREQHMLSLYRSIFEHCVSRPPSQQSSSVVSPAHAKHASKKHPSIISSTFCSSKKFPLRPLQALVSINDYGKRSSKASNGQQFCGKSGIHFEKTCSDPIKVWIFRFCSFSVCNRRTSLCR